MQPGFPPPPFLGSSQPEIPASFVGQNVCIPETYVEQLGLSFGVPKDNMPSVFHDQNIYQQGALGIYDPNSNQIGFPTGTIYEVVAYHEFLHFLGFLRYHDPLAIQREEHEVFQFSVGNVRPTWCLTCRNGKARVPLAQCRVCGKFTVAGKFCDQCGKAQT